MVGLVSVSCLGLLVCFFGTFTFVGGPGWGLLIGNGSWHITPRAICHTISRLFGWPLVLVPKRAAPFLKIISSPSNLVFCIFSLEVKKKRFHFSNRGKKTQKSKKERRKKKKEVHPLLLFPSNASTSRPVQYTVSCSNLCTSYY